MPRVCASFSSVRHFNHLRDDISSCGPRCSADEHFLYCRLPSATRALIPSKKPCSLGIRLPTRVVKYSSGNSAPVAVLYVAGEGGGAFVPENCQFLP